MELAGIWEGQYFKPHACILSMQFLPLVGGLFCTVTTSIASSCIMSFYAKLELADFVGPDAVPDNFSYITFAACAHAYFTLIVHGVMLFIYFRCSCLENCQVC